jgi:hypothetical protein
MSAGSRVPWNEKRAESVRQNLAACQAAWGLAYGFLTVTFAGDISTRDAHRMIANFRRRVLKVGFGKCITVREFTERGRPHFHILIDCLGDITTGFNWEHYHAATAWSNAGRVGPKPQGSLNRTPHLKALHTLLLKKNSRYGLGRMELVPVEKPEAVAFYVDKYLSKSLAHKPADAKRTRAVNYSQGCPRVFKGRFSWGNPFGWVWRAKLRKWATKNGCTTMAEVAALFGSKWAYDHRAAILATKLHWYPTAKHAHAGGLTVADDAVGIRIAPGSMMRFRMLRRNRRALLSRSRLPAISSRLALI